MSQLGSVAEEGRDAETQKGKVIEMIGGPIRMLAGRILLWAGSRLLGYRYGVTSKVKLLTGISRHSVGGHTSG